MVERRGEERREEETMICNKKDGQSRFDGGGSGLVSIRETKRLKNGLVFAPLQEMKRQRSGGMFGVNNLGKLVS